MVEQVTTTPSAAEVMWTSEPCCNVKEGNGRCPDDCKVWTRWDGKRDAYGTEAPDEHTPDDMLAFLRERGWQFHANSNVMSHTVTWYATEFGSIAETPVRNAPTLHAALEQAVIAVGRADE